ncbi:MAG: GH3 auxin-responsive promoter family protein [Bacteroidia bacterium]|nr:GH3 auxin-responsive promoter family protein [Bacteroidia bacterium]
MKLLVHKIASWVLKRRMEQIENFSRHPHKTQDMVLSRLIQKGRETEWGKTYGYKNIHSIENFRSQVPISSYEDLHPWIERAFKGESHVLWPGKTQQFAKSSGTTNDKSKYIPVSLESMDDSHIKAGQDMLCMYFTNKPESKLFAGKTLSIGGSHQTHSEYGDVISGDLSALIVENVPRFYELCRAPSKSVALMDNWEEKLPRMAEEIIDDDITGIAGVPTWTLVLIHKLMEMRGTDNLLDIWPNLELYLHGGVNFDPYREQFKSLIPSDQMSYLNCYNASEGFFAVQNELEADDMLLLLDYGIYFEFVPAENIHEDHPKAYSLDEVELGRNYAMIISTNGGLWRYNIGDTICFTSKDPFKIRVTGRTKHFINAFGEELMVDNAERAITKAARETEAIVGDYTAAPIYFEGLNKGGHEWLIEFEKEPTDINSFTHIMDETLKSLNSDYEAKRKGNLALGFPLLRVMPKGTFHHWMKKRGKLGGQNKVPRLANNRKYVEDILNMLSVRK